ncbi:hypothetical protein [Methyloglobulus sp.]|uniref:hypothetical protein n=1 Tax=Methyloglobulus sp. TaxID=2518622 RepID=UPI003989E500
MKKDAEDKTLKALRGRYALGLGAENIPINGMNRKLIRRFFGLGACLLLLLFVVWVLKDPESVSFEDSQLTQDSSKIQHLETGSAQSLSDLNNREQVVLANSNSNVSQKSPDILASAKKGGNDSTSTAVPQYLVIIESTISKSDAIEKSKALATLGFSSEVILSVTGYYGVVLGRFNHEEALKAIDKAIASRIVTNKPYLMTIERVTSLVYPAHQ